MFVTLDEAKKTILEGKILHIAADESLLEQLPQGKWIAGTTPYFITENGGITCKDRLFIHEIGDAIDCKTMVYNSTTVLDVSRDAYKNGMSFLVMPFASDAAVYYAREAPNSRDLLMNPTVGWISGFDLSTDSYAKVYDGVNGASYKDKAVALHICLPDNKCASLGIVNIFSTDENNASILFPDNTLTAKKCVINGKEVVFADYIAEKGIDTQLPLVADYNGIYINVSIKNVSTENGTVDLYAPVFKDKEYRFASQVNDYAESFSEQLKPFSNVKPVFSCNCILNYLYGKLDGKATPPFSGPVTFGEVAYQLLNQTLVYAEIIDK